MVGIILAGGSGTRLNPITNSISKQIIPIYDKPMIYYPLSVLMLAGIKDILIISTPNDLLLFKKLLGDGSKIGINLCYAEQPSPDGLAQAFIIGEKFIKNESVCLILGDNVFYGSNFTEKLNKSLFLAENEGISTIFGYKVKDPERYGVAEFDKHGKCISIEEKPSKPKSNYAIPGLYFYTNDVIDIAKSIKPSDGGELEISSVNQIYLEREKLHVEKLPLGLSWYDTGTFDSLFDTSAYIKAIQDRQGTKIACIEEIAYKNGWISLEDVHKIGETMSKNSYGQYLLNIE